MDYADKLPPSPWYIFAPPPRYIFPPPLTTGSTRSGVASARKRDCCPAFGSTTSATQGPRRPPRSSQGRWATGRAAVPAGPDARRGCADRPPESQNQARRQRRTGPRTPLWLRSANRRPAKTQPQRGREDQPRNPIMEMVRGTADSDARKATKGTGEARKPRHPLLRISTTQSRSGARRSAGPHESRTDSRQRSEWIASILGATST